MVFQECLYGMSILGDLLRGDICLQQFLQCYKTLAKEIEQTIQMQKVKHLQKTMQLKLKSAVCFYEVKFGLETCQCALSASKAHTKKSTWPIFFANTLRPMNGTKTSLLSFNASWLGFLFKPRICGHEVKRFWAKVWHFTLGSFNKSCHHKFLDCKIAGLNQVYLSPKRKLRRSLQNGFHPFRLDRLLLFLLLLLPHNGHDPSLASN